MRTAQKKGYFHEAEGGTLFLDEVGNLALETQQMLLRAIQERRYRPVGDKSDRSFNVRIIAATNEDLEIAVSEKRFRQDLLYRLHDFVITVPPLRDCQEDIMPLAEFFREIANKELECNVAVSVPKPESVTDPHMAGQRAGASAENHGCGIAGARRCCNERASGTCRDETDLPVSFAPSQWRGG